MRLPAVPPPSPTSFEAGDDKITPVEGVLIGWGSDGRVANTQLKGLDVTTSPCAQWQDHLRNPDAATKRLISATWGNGAPKWICVELIPEVGWLEPGDSGGAHFIHRFYTPFGLRGFGLYVLICCFVAYSLLLQILEVLTSLQACHWQKLQVYYDLPLCYLCCRGWDRIFDCSSELCCSR